MDLPTNIEINPDIMGGKPCIKGTRIPAALIVQMIAGGDTVEDILRAYPQLAKEHVLACLQYAADAISEEVVLAWA